MKIEDLHEYREHEVDFLNRDWAARFFQKHYTDEDGDKYFIHIYQSRLDEHRPMIFSARMYFQKDGQLIHFAIEPVHDLKQLEDLVETIFKAIEPERE